MLTKDNPLAPFIIDIEASGFSSKSYPIEIGFVDQVGNSWCSLILPENEWHFWDESAENVHHITRDILHQHGKPSRYVADQLNDRLRGMVVYTDGWAHDYVWMARLFDAAGIYPSFKLEDLRQVLTSEQETKWHETKALLLHDLNATRHRASIDAKILQLTWLNTRS